MLIAIVKEDELVLIKDYLHVVGLFKHNDVYYLYDPSASEGEYQNDSIEKIGSMLFDIISEKGKNGVMGISIFGVPDIESLPYPTQKSLLEKINSNVDREVLLAGAIESGSLGCIESLKFFMSCGVDPSEKDKDNDSAFGAAVVFNQVTIVEQLLKLGADPNQGFYYQEHPLYKGYITTALNLAAKLGYIRMEKLLLAQEK